MARISSEKAVEAVGNNRFNLVLIAAQRARELARGGAALIDREGHTNTIVALKEIEEGKIDPNEYLRKYIKKH